MHFLHLILIFFFFLLSASISVCRTEADMHDNFLLIDNTHFRAAVLCFIDSWLVSSGFFSTLLQTLESNPLFTLVGSFFYLFSNGKQISIKSTGTFSRIELGVHKCVSFVMPHARSDMISCTLFFFVRCVFFLVYIVNRFHVNFPFH